MSISATPATLVNPEPLAEALEVALKAQQIKEVSEKMEVVSTFKNRTQSALFIVAILSGQALMMAPFGAQLSTLKAVAEHLGVEGEPGQIGWTAAAYSLTSGSFVLLGVRLGDVYGHRLIWLGSLAWQAVWNLVSGFATSPAFYDAARGMTGIGSGLMLPVSIALCRTRALIFGFFGALAPFSAAGGSVFEALLAQLVSVPWMWWFDTIKNVVLLVLGWYAIPASLTVGTGGPVDWFGAFLGVGGLALFNFAFNQSVLAGWDDPAVIATVVIGLVLILLFGIWETYGTRDPILPLSVFNVPTFKAVIFSALKAFMSFGTFIYYFSLIAIEFRGTTPLQLSAYYTPMTVLAPIAACLSAFLVRRISAQYILAGGLIAMVMANVLLFTSPAQGIYWTHMMFSISFAAFGPDLTFTAAQLIASNTVPLSQQGVAGSLVGTVFNYGFALGIGLGGVVELKTNVGGSNPFQGMRGGLYLGAGMAGLGAILVLTLVRVPKNVREGYVAETAPGPVTTGEKLV